MKELIMLMGLPGSGKTTWAQGQTGYTRVNKDSIRAVLKSQGWVWSREAEKDVITERDKQIVLALQDGHSVISDDTNFGWKHKVRLEQLAHQGKAKFRIKRFDIPLDTCLQRNNGREEATRVPDHVIQEMYNKFIVPDPAHWPLSAPQAPAPARVEFDEHLMPAIICDLDGTLALNNGHRSHYDASTCDQDDLCRPVKKLLEIYYRFMGYQILYVSGREDKYRPQTNSFMLTHHCPPGPLMMRPTGDFRKDYIVKQEIFDREIRGKYNVELVVDDRPSVIQMWRSLGLYTLAVGSLEEF